MPVINIYHTHIFCLITEIVCCLIHNLWRQGPLVYYFLRVWEYYIPFVVFPFTIGAHDNDKLCSIKNSLDMNIKVGLASFRPDGIILYSVSSVRTHLWVEKPLYLLILHISGTRSHADIASLSVNQRRFLGKSPVLFGQPVEIVMLSLHSWAPRRATIILIFQVLGMTERVSNPRLQLRRWTQ